MMNNQRLSTYVLSHLHGISFLANVAIMPNYAEASILRLACRSPIRKLSLKVKPHTDFNRGNSSCTCTVNLSGKKISYTQVHQALLNCQQNFAHFVVVIYHP